jgi:septal ring factor EnvC (AmiA/AmiB activator)
MQWFRLFSLVTLIALHLSSVHASHTRSPATADRLQQHKRELQHVRRQLAQYTRQLRRTETTETSVLARLDTLTLRQEALSRNLRRTEGSLHTLRAEAEKLTQDHARLLQRAQRQESLLRQRLRQLYKLGRLPYVTLFLAANDVTDLLYKVQYMRRLIAHDRQHIQHFRTALQQANDAQEALAAHQQRIIDAQTTLQRQQRAFHRERQRKVQLLQRLRQEKRLATQAVAELTRTSQQLSRFIEHVHRASEVASHVPVKKGHMLWPVNGPLLSSFGKVRHRTLDVSTFHKGIYIGASVGSDVRAIGAGEVVYADWFAGFGRLLVVDHGDHVISLYGHASDIVVHVGDIIHSHQVVAKVGESSALGEPALYFEIRHHTEPQDPLLWLRQRTARLTE